MNGHFIQKAVKTILIPTLIAGGLTACGYAKSGTNQGTKTQSSPAAPGTTKSNNTTNINSTDQSDRTVSLRATDIADDVPGVARATAVAHGKDVVVGVDAKPGTDIKSLEQNVYNTLTKRIPGYNIHVTTNKNLHTRIQTLSTSLSNKAANTGQSALNVGKDIGDIIRDIGRTITAPLR
jgi:hypothetical protein